MSGRIRGHYRIDSSGRVQPLQNVNAAAKPNALPSSPPRGRTTGLRSRRRGVHGLTVVALCILLSQIGKLMQPRIEQAVMSMERAHLASVRSAFIQSHPALVSLLARRQ